MSIRIIGFAQLHEEERKGNLERFAQNMESLCDTIYVWDQNSQDNSRDVYEEYGWNVHYSPNNDFENEISCKQSLLQWVLSEQSDGWILWLDGDSKLDCTKEELSQLIYATDHQGHDGIAFGHLNLWDNEKQYRIDNNYMHLDDIGVISLWKISPKLSFFPDSTLHSRQYPATIRSVLDAREVKILHYGFLTHKIRQEKYETYKKLGQKGYDLDRLIDISSLECLTYVK